MRIACREIGPGHPPYLIAEISGEHRGNFGTACDLIKAAKVAGADAAKLQCFDPMKLADQRGGRDTIVTEPLWAGRTLGDLYAETVTPKAWFPDLFDYTKDVGIALFASVFDPDDVEFLHALDCPAFKIASREGGDRRLVKAAASTGRPLIISSGADGFAISVAAAAIHTPDVALLYCVSQYPAPIEAIDFDEIGAMRHRYGLPIGFSDHTAGIEAALLAVDAGASLIEKHITLSREDGGPDQAFSLEPQEFATMVKQIRAR